MAQQALFHQESLRAEEKIDAIIDWRSHARHQRLTSYGYWYHQNNHNHFHLEYQIIANSVHNNFVGSPFWNMTSAWRRISIEHFWFVFTQIFYWESLHNSPKYYSQQFLNPYMMKCIMCTAQGCHEQWTMNKWRLFLLSYWGPLVKRSLLNTFFTSYLPYILFFQWQR